MILPKNSRAVECLMEYATYFVRLIVESRILHHSHHMMTWTIVYDDMAIGMVFVGHIFLLVGSVLNLVILDGHQYHVIGHHQYIVLKRFPFYCLIFAFAFLSQHVQRQLATCLEKTPEAGFWRVIMLLVVILFLNLKHVNLIVFSLANPKIIKCKYRHIFYYLYF